MMTDQEKKRGYQIISQVYVLNRVTFQRSERGYGNKDIIKKHSIPINY